MKKILLLLISTSVFCTSFSQNVTSFIEIWAIPKSFSQKVQVSVNYGQEYGSLFKNNNDLRLVDSNGNPIVFNNQIDALNYFGYRGWKLEAAWQTVSAKGSGAYVFIMSKSAPVEKFTTRSDYKSERSEADSLTNYKEYDIDKAIAISKDKGIALVGYTKDTGVRVYYDYIDNTYLIEGHFVRRYGEDCLQKLISASEAISQAE
ncbi:hypothetical protein [uncultured Alistipes sp.]|uniref:hypothetical protein n=1 Tax=uncultured Alistipes sp. TaxID=538949 RepID=UPI003209368D